MLYKQDACQINATVKLKRWHNWNSQCCFLPVRCFVFSVRRWWSWFRQPLSHIGTHGKWMRTPNNKSDLKQKNKKGEKANQKELCICKEYLQLEWPSCSSEDMRFFSVPQLYPPSFFLLELFVSWNIVGCVLVDLRFPCHKLFNTGEREKKWGELSGRIFLAGDVFGPVFSKSKNQLLVSVVQPTAAPFNPNPATKELQFCWLNPVLSGTGFHFRCVSGRCC